MNSTMDRNMHHECVQRAIAMGRAANPAALPELLELLKMPSAEIRRLAASAIDYKIGMLKKLKLYQQEGKRIISIYPEDKETLAEVLRHKLGRYMRMEQVKASETDTQTPEEAIGYERL